jgi:hypothetical protein
MRRTSWLAVFSTSVVGAVALLAAAGAPGCGVSPAISVVHFGTDQKGDDIKGDAVKTRRSGQEAYVGLHSGYYVIRTLDDWRGAWPSGKEAALPASLDGGRSMLFLGVAEDKDAVELRIQKVIETGDHLHVWVRETRAGENCTPNVERTPFDAVVAPRIDKPVKYYVEEVRAESCGPPPAVAVNCRVGDARDWKPKVTAQPGDSVDCEMHAESRGKFAIVDSALLLGELPGGSSAKLAYAKGPSRGTFSVDVFGTYTIRGEATDEGLRKTQATATVDALPPKTNDVLVQLVWTNFDVSDDPDTFPRVKLRATEETVRGRKPVECSLDSPHPDVCEVKTRSAYTHMKLKASDKHVPLDVFYTDERIEKGPLVCVQLYFNGVRTGETCDRQHRSAEERWQVGTVDMATGTLIGAAGGADAGADGGDGGTDASAATTPAATKPAKK